TRTGIFNLSLAWNAVNEVDLVAWWEGNFKESLPELCKVASRILTIPLSSAATERNWSNFFYIHDKKRSWLTPPRVLKLVYIYSNYKLTCSKLESSDMTKAVEHFNNRPSSENNQFELLDPSSDDEENSENELIEDDENEIVESSESEIELTTKNDTDSESE
ncbi:31584_t:CDS:1, partial [Gigaspora margarita]